MDGKFNVPNQATITKKKRLLAKAMMGETTPGLVKLKIYKSMN
jgi:hypothetical protein